MVLGSVLFAYTQEYKHKYLADIRSGKPTRLPTLTRKIKKIASKIYIQRTRTRNLETIDKFGSGKKYA